MVEGYREVWKRASNIQDDAVTDYTLLRTINCTKKYQDFSRIEELVKKYLQENPIEHKLIISLGCGNAKDLVCMQEIFPQSQLFGIDTSREALAWARKAKTNGMNLICATISDLPFRRGVSFDALIAGQCVDLDFEDQYMERSLKELTSYASTNARFYLTFYGTSNTQLELYKCTPIGNSLDKLGWTTRYGVGYDFEDDSFAKGVFWVEERTSL